MSAPKSNKPSTEKIFPIALMAIAVVAFLYMILWAITPNWHWPWSKSVTNTVPPMDNIVYCAADVQACPDGSFVNRVPPTCEFSACPTSTNTNTSVNADSTTPSNTNRVVSETLQVKFIDRSSNQPISNTAVQLYSDNGIRCVTMPCNTNGRNWQGTTDAQGRVVVPANMVDESMDFTLLGYQGRELHLSGMQQSDGSWILPLNREE